MSMTQDQMMAEIAKLRDTNARLISEKNAKVSFKVSQKGAISVYGLGRFPLTLHASQWDSLFASMQSLTAFVETNRKTCEQQSTMWKTYALEAKAQNISDEKAEDWIKTQFVKTKNPYVSAPKAE